MRKVLYVAIVCVLIISTLSGCGLLQKLGFEDKDSDELAPVSSVVMNEEDAGRLSNKVPIHLYFANEDNTRLKLEVRHIPLSEAKKSVNNLATYIVNELVKGPAEGSKLKATIPKEAKLHSSVAIDGGIATVDFSQAFVDKHPGGKDAEKLTIYSIVNSLTELKEVQQVKFRINGVKQKSFKGNYKFDNIFPRSTTMISRETTSAVESATDGSDKTNTGNASASPKATQQPSASPAKSGAALDQETSESLDDSEDVISDEVLE